MTEKLNPMVKVISRFFVLTLAFVSLAFTVQAQSTISGVVKDASGEPMVGVAVVAVGTTTGVTTSVNGSYTITVPSNATQLRYSFLGMEPSVVTIGSETIINVTLAESPTMLDEIVAIGYGDMRRRDLTGAVASVRSDVLESMPVTSVSEAIAGRLAGVQVTSSEGGPDANIRIRVRGGTSITGSNDPLYIVDGFPVSSINDIPAADIESIDVLKDAATTAIYGARGANGVIIVTTKDGAAADKVTVNFNAYAGFKQLSKELDVLDPYEYVLWQYELSNYVSSAVDYDKSFTKFYGAFDDLELYKNKKATNWQDKIFGRNAVTQNYNMSIAGGGEKATFNISLAHVDDESIMMESGFVRDNINAKLKLNISKKIWVDFSTRWSRAKINGAGTSTEGASSVPRLRHTLRFAPTAGISDFVVGDEDLLEEIENVSQLQQPDVITREEYRFTERKDEAYNAAFNWRIIKPLTFRSEFGFSKRTDDHDRYYGVHTGYARRYRGLPVASKESRNRGDWKVTNTLSYSKVFNDVHSVSFMVGQEATSKSDKTTFMEVTDFPRGTTRQQALAGMGLGIPRVNETLIDARENTLSYFGRAFYSYDDKYLLTVTFRSDGSSIFASGNRWGYFPSAAFAWKMDQEPWLNNVNWLYMLKLRLSYGTVGNDRIPPDTWRLLYRPYLSSKPISIDGVEQNVLIPSDVLPNRNVKWETTVTRNLGVDASFWHGRLNATVDLYWNTTRDLLLKASIPDISGFSYQFQNIGETSNKGLELTLDGAIIAKKEFRLNAGFNIAFNKNRIEKLSGTDKYPPVSSKWYNSTNPDHDFLVEKGKSMGRIYGYKTLGMYTIDDFNYTYNETTGRAEWTLKEGVANSATATSSPILPGTLKLWDKNGDGNVTSDDRTVIGNALPKATGGFNVSMGWKGFDLAAYFNFVIGNDVYNANKLELTSYPLTRKYNNLFSLMKDRFTYIDRNTGESLIHDIDRLRAANTNAKYWSPIISSVPIHSWAIEDGSFLRLSNLTFGYTLPERITKKFFVQTLRIYFTGHNLALFTNYSGYDPEVDAKGSNPLTPGVDYSAFPRARTYVFGINVTF